MLNKNQRHFTKWEIDLSYKKGKKTFGKTCLLRFVSKENKKKVIIIISTKVSKSAVKRNRLRRQYYEQIQTIWDKLPNGYFLFSLKPGCEIITSKEILSDILFTLKKCQQIPNKNRNSVS